MEQARTTGGEGTCVAADEVERVRAKDGGEGSRSARIQDVARLADVSTATVSRALATPERVSPQARARVFEAIAQVGYVPNPMARSLRSQKSRMVLVVLPNLDNIFFSKILRGVEETLFEAGYGMIIGDLDGSPDKEARFAAFTAAGQVDGPSSSTATSSARPGTGTGPPCAPTCPWSPCARRSRGPTSPRSRSTTGPPPGA
jgi:LacI family repressor for deo operon, udp, cdd, tsx, nupC, and nupG